MRGQGWLAAGELHRHLTPRLDGNRVVEQRLDFFPGKLVHESDLVGIHETRIAHHVAAVGQVDGENRASPVLDGAAAVVMQFFVVMGADIPAGKRLLEMPEELRINGDDIFEMSVDGAILDHQDFAVALDDLRLDFTGPFVQRERDNPVCRRQSVGESRARSAGTTNRFAAASPAEASTFHATSAAAYPTTWV